MCTHLKIFYPEEQLKVKTRTEKSMELYEKVRDERRENRGGFKEKIFGAVNE